MPTLQAIVLTPLCPHTLNIRPIVLGASQTGIVRVVSSQDDIMVTIDGQEGVYLKEEQHVEVRKSDLTTKLLVPEDFDFLGLLREKL
jgi:NAD+ kinase